MDIDSSFEENFGPRVSDESGVYKIAFSKLICIENYIFQPIILDDSIINVEDISDSETLHDNEVDNVKRKELIIDIEYPKETTEVSTSGTLIFLKKSADSNISK